MKLDPQEVAAVRLGRRNCSRSGSAAANTTPWSLHRPGPPNARTGRKSAPPWPLFAGVSALYGRSYRGGDAKCLMMRTVGWLACKMR
jgi:hypothetical protein